MGDHKGSVGVTPGYAPAQQHYATLAAEAVDTEAAASYPEPAKHATATYPVSPGGSAMPAGRRHGVGQAPAYPPAPVPPGVVAASGAATPVGDYWSDTSRTQAGGYPSAAPPGYGAGGYTHPVGYAGAVASSSSPHSNEAGKPGQKDTVVLMHGAKQGDRPSGNVHDAPYHSNTYNEADRGRGRPPVPLAVQYPSHDRGWTEDLRKGFIRKVLLLVAVQLLITTGISVAFYTVDPIKDFIGDNPWIIWACLLMSFVMLFTVSCFRKARKYPYDYILLFGFTLFFSVCVGAITAQYDVEAVAIALGVTCACVFGAFFVAAFTKLDLTKIGGFLVAILFGVIVLSIIAIFVRSKWFHFAIALVAAILFTVFLIYDLQLLIGGRSHEFSPDDYVIAALNIYIDVIQIFLNVLRLIGIASE